MEASIVKTRVLVISDTHCAPLVTQEESGTQSGMAFRAPLPAADLLIHCGDLTYTGKMAEYHEALDMLKQIDASVKLVIAGNHDLSLDRDFVFGHLNRDEAVEEQAELAVKEARDLWTAPDGRARKEGVRFLDEGMHTVDLANGARIRIYASPYTPEFCDWGFPYRRDEDRFNTPVTSLSNAKNIAPYPVPSFSPTESSVDIMITHGPPYGRLDKTDGGDFAGCPHLLRAVMRARPLIHCFGHIHEGRGVELLNWSRDADQTTTSPSHIVKWKKDGWRAGVDAIKEIAPDPRTNQAVLDISDKGENLIRGQQTLLVNASIMNVAYKPVNAPWLIDVDLPKL